MIDWWAYVNICPIIEGKMDFREDCYLDDRIWGEESGEFLHKHFGDRGIKTKNFEKLNNDDEVQFVTYALQNAKVYEALRDYLAMLHLTQSEFSELMHWMSYKMLLGANHHGKINMGASVEGVNAKYYWRDILITCTIDFWRHKYPYLPIKNNSKSLTPKNLSISTIIHEALNKVKPQYANVPQPDGIYRIWHKAYKEENADRS